MITYISILRGINVSGRNTIKMDALRKLLTDQGFSSIQTYIQSGNIIYQYKKTDAKKLNALINTNIKKHFEFDIPVITLTAEELKKIVKLNPFVKDKAKEISFLHITFLEAKPIAENIAALKDVKFLPDQFQLIDNAVYLYCPKGYGETKLSNKFFENKLKLTATTRNWKTTNELISLAQKINTAVK
jgi:uncharacterized protein (DUF1697 family)